MAASTNLKLSTFLMLFYLLCQFTMSTPFNNKYKDHTFGDSAGLLADGSFLVRYRLISLPLVTCRIIIYRKNLQSKFKVSYMVKKAIKHGSTAHILLVKPFIMDLTVCVDISPNPGPDLDDSKANYLGSHSGKSPSSRMDALESKTNNLTYTSRFLHSLRFTSSSKYIDRNIFITLGLLCIQKPFRGRRSGRKVKQREAHNRYFNVSRTPYNDQICILSSRTDTLLQNQYKIPVLISNRLNTLRPYTKSASSNLVRIPLIDLTSDLVFKLNPGPVTNIAITTIVSRRCDNTTTQREPKRTRYLMNLQPIPRSNINNKHSVSVPIDFCLLNTR